MKMDHTFHPQHGFTGSAGKSMKPTIPGYKHGGEVEHHAHGAKDHYGKRSHKDHDGESHHGGVHYDEHGFQHHKVGGAVKGAIKKAIREHEEHEHEGKHTNIKFKHGGKIHK